MSTYISNGNFKIPEDYKNLGWVNNWKSQPEELKKCNELNHKLKHIDNSIFKGRGTDDIYICEECKILYHIDSSD